MLNGPVSRLFLPVFAALLIACAGLIGAALAAEPEYPALTGRVVDNANLLSAEDERQLAVDLEALEAKSTDQVVVVTLPSLQGFEIEDFGYRLGRHWGIGQKDKDNGVLLIVAPKERKVRIEVGRGLEPLLTDALSKVIIENAILPRFRSGDFPGGIKAGVRDIVAVLTGDAEELKTRARSPDRDEVADWVAIMILTVWVIIFIAVMWSIIQSVRHGQSATGKGGKKGSSGWTWGSGGSSGGGWSGGGGFSGGGGGFGGGGSSGGW